MNCKGYACIFYLQLQECMTVISFFFFSASSLYTPENGLLHSCMQQQQHLLNTRAFFSGQEVEPCKECFPSRTRLQFHRILLHLNFNLVKLNGWRWTHHVISFCVTWETLWSNVPNGKKRNSVNNVMQMALRNRCITTFNVAML